MPAHCPRTNYATVAAKEQQRYILECRKKGMSFPAIAQSLGLSNPYVYKQFKKALREITEETAEEVLQLELAKLDDLESTLREILTAVYPLVSGGRVVYERIFDDDGEPILDSEGNPKLARLLDNAPRLASIDRILKVMERRSSLLGLDKPKKTAMTSPDGTKEASFVQFYLPENGRDDAEGNAQPG